MDIFNANYEELNFFELVQALTAAYEFVNNDGNPNSVANAKRSVIPVILFNLAKFF